MDVRLKSNVLHKGVVLEIGTTFSSKKVEQTNTEKASEPKKGRSKK